MKFIFPIFAIIILAAIGVALYSAMPKPVKQGYLPSATIHHHHGVRLIDV